jgi:hypothetical protein
MATQPMITRTQLQLVRGALLGGVVLFGAAVFLIQRSQPPEPLAADAAARLRLFFIVIGLVTAVGLFVVRSLAERAADFQKAARLAIIGWAVAESLALLGGVIYLLTGRPLLYLIGTMVLIAACVLVPIPEET